jgi:hypothetical protein
MKMVGKALIFLTIVILISIPVFSAQVVFVIPHPSISIEEPEGLLEHEIGKVYTEYIFPIIISGVPFTSPVPRNCYLDITDDNTRINKSINLSSIPDEIEVELYEEGKARLYVPLPFDEEGEYLLTFTFSCYYYEDNTEYGYEPPSKFFFIEIMSPSGFNNYKSSLDALEQEKAASERLFFISVLTILGSIVTNLFIARISGKNLKMNFDRLISAIKSIRPARRRRR